MPSNHLILCCPLLFLPSIFLASGSFPVSWLSQVAKALELQYQSFQWIFTVENILENWLVWSPRSPWCSEESSPTPLFKSISSSVLSLLLVQLLHPYTTTGETIALTGWTFVGKMMSLLFNMLSGFVITFLPRSKHLLISWLQSPSTVILETKKIKSATVFHFFLICLLWNDGTRCHDFRIRVVGIGCLIWYPDFTYHLTVLITVKYRSLTSACSLKFHSHVSISVFTDTSNFKCPLTSDIQNYLSIWLEECI